MLWLVTSQIKSSIETKMIVVSAQVKKAESKKYEMIEKININNCSIIEKNAPSE